MLPLRLLLVRECAHADLLILAAKKAVENSSFKLHSLSDPQILTLVHDLFARLDRYPAVASNGLGGGQRSLHALLGRRKDPRRQPPVIRVLPAEVLAGEDQLHRAALADRAGQTLRAPGAGDDAQLDLRLAEVGFRRAVEDVAHHGQLAATAQRVPVDGRDDGLLDRVGELAPGLDEVVAVRFGEGLAAHLLDVGAGGEGFVRAGQDGGADGGVLVEGAEGLVELEDERGEERVEGFRAMQLD
nr:hypothetical protein CFP56_03330 [Quercus suber]